MCNINPWTVSRDISQRPVEDHYKAAKSVVRQDPHAFFSYYPNFHLNDKQRYRVLSIIAQANGRLMTDEIKSIGLKDEWRRYELALKAAKNDGPYVASRFSDYQIKKAEWVENVALKAILENPRSTPKHIRQFPLPDEEFRYKLLKIAVDRDATKALELVKKFNMTKPEFIFEIAKIKASKDTWNFIFEVPEWNIVQEEWREELFSIAASGKYREKAFKEVDSFNLTASLQNQPVKRL